MDKKRKTGKFVYKNEECMHKMHEYYDKAMESLKIDDREEYTETSFGKTHVIIAGDESKPRLFTLHGGNGITPLNLKLFSPLLDSFCIIAPDVIGMPGKSDPYRNLNSKTEDFGRWLSEILDKMKIEKITFAVSSYSSAMMLSLAKISPQKIDKAILLVPSGIAHGPIIPILFKMSGPFIKYYHDPSEKTMAGIMNTMSSQSDELWDEFFQLMMSAYKMEMRAPREYRKSELSEFTSDVIIFASDEDIFFPARKVFPKAEKLFVNKPLIYKIEGKHLPSESTMQFVCDKIRDFIS